MIAVLTIEVTLEVEALFVTDSIVDQGVEAARGGVANVAVTAVQLTGTNIALGIAVPVTHLAHAFCTAVVAVAALAVALVVFVVVVVVAAVVVFVIVILEQ